MIVEDQPWVFSVPFARRGRKAHPYQLSNERSHGAEYVTYHQEGTDHVGLVGVEPRLFTCVAEHVLCKFLGALDLGACLSIRDSCIVDKDVEVLLLRLDLLQDLPLRLLALQLERKKEKTSRNSIRTPGNLLNTVLGLYIPDNWDDLTRNALAVHINDRLELLLRPANNIHLRTVDSQCLCNHQPNARSTASNNGDLVLDIENVGLLELCVIRHCRIWGLESARYLNRAFMSWVNCLEG